MSRIVDAKHPFLYDGDETPKTYKCHHCGQVHVKLWRLQLKPIEQQTLICAPCLSRRYAEKGFLPRFIQTKQGGYWTSRKAGIRSDRIGSFVPAVPSEDNRFLWGYDSVPKVGIEWWHRLPVGV